MHIRSCFIFLQVNYRYHLRLYTSALPVNRAYYYKYICSKIKSCSFESPPAHDTYRYQVPGSLLCLSMFSIPVVGLQNLGLKNILRSVFAGCWAGALLQKHVVAFRIAPQFHCIEVP